MFTAGLSISDPKQFTLFAVIFKSALKNPKCTLALHHHLRCQAPLSLPETLLTKDLLPLEYKSFPTIAISAAHILSQHKLHFSPISHFPGWPLSTLRSHLAW